MSGIPYNMQANKKNKGAKAQKTKSVATARPSQPREIAVAYSAGQMRPSFRSVLPLTKGAEVRYRGVDYAGSIASATSATNSQYATIYATNATLFPRLSQLADCFIRYRFNKLIIHLIGRSASTVAGNLALVGVVTDGLGGALVFNTESLIKNAENVLVLRGWESGRVEIPVKESGLTWLNTDTDAGTSASGLGAFLGYMYQSITATAAAGDLKWDLYMEYDVELAGSVAGGSVN